MGHALHCMGRVCGFQSASSPLEGEPNRPCDLVGGKEARDCPPTKIVKNDFGSPSRGELALWKLSAMIGGVPC